MKTDLNELCRQLEQLDADAKAKLPPVHAWKPELSGDMDLVIKTNGQWLHEGSPIVRQSLVKLFSTILRREGDAYFLVTPVEKWRIQVETYPLFYDRLSVENVSGVDTILLQGPCDYPVYVGAEHGLWVEETATGPLPVVAVRDGLNGVIGRNVYYQLVAMATQSGEDIFVTSGGKTFTLVASEATPAQ